MQKLQKIKNKKNKTQFNHFFLCFIYFSQLVSKLDLLKDWVSYHNYRKRSNIASMEPYFLAKEASLSRHLTFLEEKFSYWKNGMKMYM